MKGLKLGLVIMAAALLTIGLGGMAYAFHDGGVANCESCHTMHNSIGDQTVLIKGGTQFQGVAYLLKGSDQSSTCINCHSGTSLSSKNVFTSNAPSSITGAGPVNYTPGGDFAWLTKSFSSSIPGDRLGHNVVAKDFSLQADGTLKKAPGGSYLASNLTCISCHDPHPKARIDNTYKIVYPKITTSVPPIYKSGSYGDLPTANEAVGVYRLLGGNGYVPKSYDGGPIFSNDPPVAVAPSSYNRMETSTDTRVAYGKGMSEWCANCHGSIHADNVSKNFIHPASNAAVLTSAVVANYNAYKKSGDLTNVVATSYTSLVPFEEGLGLSAANITTLKTHAAGSTAGPSGTENVMCLTCHRAHATGFKNITRWNNSEFITSAGAYALTGTMTATEYKAAMYDRDPGVFATYQRSLCNKCHVKD
jgi:hypothetical protein